MHQTVRHSSATLILTQMKRTRTGVGHAPGGDGWRHAAHVEPDQSTRTNRQRPQLVDRLTQLVYGFAHEQILAWLEQGASQ